MVSQQEHKVLDHGYVRYIRHAGDDLSALEAARMSTGNPTGVDEGKDDRLRERLWRDRHTSPFEMNWLELEVQVPIFEARHIQRHRAFSFNEFSGRYAEMPDLYYIPDPARIKAQHATNHQMSGDAMGAEAQRLAVEVIEAAARHASALYRGLLKEGVARETARLVLPLNQYTRFRMGGNLRNWFHFLGLRLAEDTQWETRQTAEAVAAIIRDVWPKTYEVFDKYSLAREAAK